MNNMSWILFAFRYTLPFLLLTLGNYIETFKMYSHPSCRTEVPFIFHQFKPFKDEGPEAGIGDD